MVVVTITNIRHALREIKHFDWSKPPALKGGASREA